MKKLKRLSVILIAMILATMSFSNAFAATNDSSEKNSSEKYGEVTVYPENEDPQTPTDSSYKEPEKRVFVTEEFAKSQQNNKINPVSENGMMQPFYGESETSTVKATEYYTKTTTPDGQPTAGTRFPTGGGFYINKSGGVTVSFSVETSWGPVSYSVAVWYTSTGNIGGVYVQVPDKTNYFKAKIDRTIRYRHVLVDHYQYGQYQYSYWTTWTDVYTESFYCVRA